MRQKKGCVKNCLNEISDDSGFTLLELVIAVGILLVLTVGGLLAYNGIIYSARVAAVQSAADEVYKGAVAYESNGEFFDQAADEWNETSKKDKNGAQIIKVEAHKGDAIEKICVRAEMFSHKIFVLRGPGCDVQGIVDEYGSPINHGGSDDFENVQQGSDEMFAVDGSTGERYNLVVNWRSSVNAVCQPEQELWLDGDNGLPVGTTFEGYVGVFNEESWSADIELNEDVRLAENTNRYPSDDRWFYGYADYENMRVNGEFVLPEGVYWVNDTPGEVSDYESSGDSRVLEYTNTYSTVGCGNTENPGVPPVITVPSTAAECFEFKDGVITDYYYYNDDCPSDVVVPDAINGEAVVAVGDYAFYDSNLTSVVLNERLRTIGESGFSDNEITSVDFNDRLRSVGNYAFSSNSLTNVEIPGSVEVISDGAFAWNDLTSVKFNDGLESIGVQAFYDNELESVVFPNTLIIIDDRAFNSNFLTSVKFNKGLKSIGDDAFYDNYLTSVEFKEGLETIGINAFNGNSLTSVEFPSSLKTIGSSSFENNQLTSVEFKQGLETIDGFAFYNNNLTSVEFPSTLKKINRAAFQLNSLTNVVIPVGVETYSSFDPDVEVDHA